MSLVGGYPPQAYHPGAAAASLPHDLYGYHHPQARYQEPHPADTGAFYQNWMLNQQTDMTIATDSYGLGPGMGLPHPGQDGQYGQNMTNANGVMMMSIVDPITGRVRVVKRRNTANKKERRRTVSINTAFAKLRGCIPNVPSDTKLSKIKTLRLATSYIAYLMDVLNKDDPKLAEAGFKADLVKTKRETKKNTDSTVSIFYVPLFCMTPFRDRSESMTRRGERNDL